MLRSSLATVAVTTAALIAAPLLAVTTGTPAHAAPEQIASARRAPAYTKTPLWFSVMVGKKNDTPCTITADLYAPKNASSRHRVPAILTTNGFGGSKDDQAGSGKYYAAHGYTVLSYSGLGFGGSSCPISLDDPWHDGKAGRFLVSYLGGQTGHAFLDQSLTKKAPKLDIVRLDKRAHDGKHHAFDPRIGMVGGSYGGQIQFAIAGIDPRLDTIIPMITWNDLSYSLAPNNVTSNGSDQAKGVTTPVTGSAKLFWAAGFSALGVVNGMQNAPIDQQRLIGCPNFQTWVCPSLVNAATTGTLDSATFDKLHDRSLVSYLPKITIPVLLAQGEGDTLFNLNEAIATYRALRKQGTPVKMLWSDGGHSNPYPSGEIVPSKIRPAKQYLSGRFKAWFDHYLKGTDVSTGPQFAYFRDWVDYSGNAKPAYATANAFPLRGQTTYKLSAADLTTGTPAAGSQSFTTPAGGLTTSYDPVDVVSATLPFDVPDTDLPGTTASYTTPALKQPLTVVGSPVVHLTVSAPAASAATPLTLFLKILDVDADGNSTVVRDLIAPARVADPTKPFTVTMPAFAHRFDTGHQLQLVVAGGSANYRGGLTPTPVTITTGDASQTLTLPTP